MPSSQFEGLVRRTSSSDAPARRPASRSADGSRAPTASSLISAGVAQLVERQPSKLNVASSSLVSRSVIFLVSGLPNPETRRPVSGLPIPGTKNLSGLRRASEAAGEGPGRGRLNFAHLAQLVEHVLGKDEVTSSILVVGSKRLGRVSSVLASDMLPRVDKLPRVVLALDPNASPPISGRARARAFRFAVAAA